MLMLGAGSEAAALLANKICLYAFYSDLFEFRNTKTTYEYFVRVDWDRNRIPIQLIYRRPIPYGILRN